MKPFQLGEQIIIPPGYFNLMNRLSQTNLSHLSRCPRMANCRSKSTNFEIWDLICQCRFTLSPGHIITMIFILVGYLRMVIMYHDYTTQGYFLIVYSSLFLIIWIDSGKMRKDQIRKSQKYEKSWWVTIIFNVIFISSRKFNDWFFVNTRFFDYDRSRHRSFEYLCTEVCGFSAPF